MTTKKTAAEAQAQSVKAGGAIKTMRLQIAVTETDLQQSVQAAFELARSGGRELDLAFICPALKPGGPKPDAADAAPRTQG